MHILRNCFIKNFLEGLISSPKNPSVCFPLLLYLAPSPKLANND